MKPIYYIENAIGKIMACKIRLSEDFIHLQVNSIIEAERCKRIASNNYAAWGDEFPLEHALRKMLQVYEDLEHQAACRGLTQEKYFSWVCEKAVAFCANPHGFPLKTMWSE